MEDNIFSYLFTLLGGDFDFNLRQTWISVQDKTQTGVKSFKCQYEYQLGRHGSLMVSVLNSGSGSRGPSSGQGYYVVFLGKTLNSHYASLYPRV